MSSTRQNFISSNFFGGCQPFHSNVMIIIATWMTQIRRVFTDQSANIRQIRVIRVPIMDTFEIRPYLGICHRKSLNQ
jgi:hypothetical protein